MFILMISRGIPTAREPQWGCFEKDQAEALAALGHKVVVASVDSRFRLTYRRLGITHQIINGIDYYNSFLIPGAVTDIFGYKLTWAVKERQFRQIYKQIKAEHGKPDIICGEFSFCAYLGVRIKEEEAIPLVCVEHNGIFNEARLSPQTAFSARLAYNHTDRIIAVSKILQERIYHHLKKTSVVVNNMFGREFLCEDIPARSNKRINFVAVGTLGRVKGYDLLIKAFEKAELPDTGWSLTIVGDGSIKKALQQQIDEAHLHDRILLAGKKERLEVRDILLSSSVFLMPSRYENFSVALIEAQACGLPIIASDCGGARDCINVKNGIIVPVEDVTALTHAIEQMAAHIQDYDNKAIAAECRSRFSPEVIAGQLSGVFQDTINNYKNEHKPD
ncbi:MAG: glycosyltransferase [Paludibacteraceae bacterium]|nr:glycosyltransferase [Paludibacteraceae bacterium]